MVNRYTPWSCTLLCALWLCLLPGMGAAAESPPALASSASGAVAAEDYSWFELWVNEGAPASVAELENRSPAFEPATAATVNLGFTQAEAWVRFRVRYAAEQERQLSLILPKPLIDHVELVALKDGRVVQRVVTGDAVAFSSRPLGYRAFAFELEPLAGSAVTYYLRVRSPTSAVELPLRLMESTSFRRHMARENFFIGSYFGVLAVLAVAGALLFVPLRHRVFLDYALYITAFSAMMAAISGHGMMLLWPSSPAVQQVLPTFLVTLAIAAGVRFMTSFLQLARWPWLRTLLSIPLVIAIGASVLHVFGNTQAGVMLVIAAGLALCPIVIVACYVAMRAGDRFANYFLLGWLAYVVGVSGAALDMFGTVPHSTLTSYGLYVGTLVEFVVLMVALAEHMLSTQRDREAEVARTNAELATLNQNLESMVRDRTHELEERNRELGELAIRDSLTGLYNHSASIELLDQILNQSQRYGFPVASLMIDIDHFKRINDDHGHQVGDSVLESVAQALLDAVRSSDVVGRYGGEEFLIVMPHADAPAAREFSERLLRRIREIQVPGADGKHVTVSIGIAVCHPQGQHLGAADAIERADTALYRSKREGRDRLTVDSVSLVAESAGSARRELPSTPA